MNYCNLIMKLVTLQVIKTYLRSKGDLWNKPTYVQNFKPIKLAMIIASKRKLTGMWRQGLSIP